jgi:hypothetical protein
VIQGRRSKAAHLFSWELELLLASALGPYIIVGKAVVDGAPRLFHTQPTGRHTSIAPPHRSERRPIPIWHSRAIPSTLKDLDRVKRPSNRHRTALQLPNNFEIFFSST